jgi:hypothetical protein
MIVAAHQPVYLPGVVFFNKLALCDAFVFLTDVQLARGRSWQTRNRIRQAGGEQFLSVPVLRKGRGNQRIADTLIAENPGWQRRHVAALHYAYRRRPHFDTYFDAIAELLMRPWERLAELNMVLIRHLAACFGLTTAWHDSLQLDAPQGKNERLIGLCRSLGADAYLSNAGSMTYIDEAAFTAGGVTHLWQHFEHPIWDQGAPFLPHLSAVDLLFNLGPEAGDVIRACGTARPERPEAPTDRNSDDET